ncbi:relaxase domain-containing protein [Streptacidiphilus monticola]|uniref:Relaxase domain-containing protein n=1 Tax=Streptacidiphilus monticola TaxID=2161674 RepID=A0ABW1GAU2_9ACTN
MTGERAERVASSGYLGWTTLHRSAHPVDGSPGDPHLHVHVNPAHMIKCEDGRWRTPASGAVDLRRHAHLVNEIAEGLLRAKPTERHGAVFERSETGAWKLAGIPERLCAEFSRRHAQAVAMVGEGVTRDQHRATARRTAEAKEEHGTDAERLDWLTPAAGAFTGSTRTSGPAPASGGQEAVDAAIATALPGAGGSPAPAGRGADGGGQVPALRPWGRSPSRYGIPSTASSPYQPALSRARGRATSTCRWPNSRTPPPAPPWGNPAATRPGGESLRSAVSVIKNKAGDSCAGPVGRLL